MTKRKLSGYCLDFNFISGLLFVILCLAGTSCKPPLPVYFDSPLGTKIQGFDTILSGNYIPLDDVMDKGLKDFSDKYTVKYDKIIPKDTGFSFEMNEKEMNYNDVKDILGIKKDPEKIELNKKNCDSIFRALCSFNEIVSAKLGSSIDKAGPAKSVAGMIKISYDRVLFISVDSLGNNMRDTLLSLSPKVLLTRYSGKYFLNFKTEFGWEIMQLEIWENKFLCARPFYFTSYNDCSKNVSELTVSTKNIYPDLAPLLNQEKNVIGFKATLNPKLLLEKFKQSEEAVLLLKL